MGLQTRGKVRRVLALPAAAFLATACLVAPGDAAPVGNKSEGPVAGSPLPEMQSRIARIGSFFGRCDIEAHGLVMTHEVTFLGRAEVWFLAPDGVRVETDSLVAQGVQGGGCPTIRIERGDHYYHAKRCSPDALPYFEEVEPTPAGDERRVPWVPGMDFVRQPFPTPVLLSAVKVLSVREDSLGGRSAFVLAVKAGRKGGFSGDRINWWVDKQRFCLLREETLDAAGKIAGSYGFEDVTELAPGVFIPLRMVHYTREGKPDIICGFRDVKIGADLAGSLFVPSEEVPAGTKE